MLRTLLIASSLVPTFAVAHPGHVAEVAGHAHWIALGAGLLATVVAAALAATRKGTDAPADAGPEEAEVEEA